MMLVNDHPFFFTQCVAGLLRGIPVVIAAPRRCRDAVVRIVGCLSLFVPGCSLAHCTEPWREIPLDSRDLAGLRLCGLLKPDELALPVCPDAVWWDLAEHRIWCPPRSTGPLLAQILEPLRLPELGDSFDRDLTIDAQDALVAQSLLLYQRIVDGLMRLIRTALHVVYLLAQPLLARIDDKVAPKLHSRRFERIEKSLSAIQRRTMRRHSSAKLGHYTTSFVPLHSSPPPQLPTTPLPPPAPPPDNALSLAPYVTRELPSTKPPVVCSSSPPFFSTSLLSSCTTFRRRLHRTSAMSASTPSSSSAPHRPTLSALSSPHKLSLG
jgi:hypothetical protein